MTEQSLNQMKAILDNAPVAVFVCSVIDRGLLYTNNLAKELFPVSGRPGAACYHIAGFDRPCPFCHVGEMSQDGFVVREFSPPYSDRVYQLNGKLIDWAGESAHIEYILDITEKKREEEQHRKIEKELQTTFGNLPCGLCVYRLEGEKILPVFHNPAFYEIAVYSGEHIHSVEQETTYLGVHRDDLDRLQAKVKAAIRQGGVIQDTYRLYHDKAKEYRWIHLEGAVRTDAEGRQLLYGVYTDVSEQMELEREVAAANERMRRQYEDLILEHYRTPGTDELLLGHCNITQNRIIQIKDFTGCDLLKKLGRNRENFFTGLSGFIVDEKERQAFRGTYLNAPALAAFARNETEQIQTCFAKLPGQTAGCYIQIKMNMIAAPGTDDVTGVLTVTNVTDKIMSGRILHQLSVTTHDYIVDVNLLSDSFKVLSSNKNAHMLPETKGCHSERVAHMADAVVLPKDRETYKKALDADGIRRRLQDENSYTVTYSLCDEDGKIRTKNMTVFSIDLRLGRVCLVCTDITESVRALEDALALAKAASQAKSDFLTTMSHDIRTPMNAIMGMTTLALAYLDDREQVENCLRKIKTANKHLLSLINDVMDMNRLEGSKIAMNLRQLSLAGLIGEITDIIEPQATNAGLRFAARKTNIRKEYFYGDSLRINQILINLLSNAVKFTPEGGRVEFLVEEIPAVKGEKHVRYRFTVRDTGIGMSEDFLNRAFEPFTQENTAMHIEGTGLGLSIVKGLVEQMGGTISVESRVNQGAAFRVELEFEAAESTESISKSRASQNDVPLPEKPFAGRTFLIAEDHPLNAELLCQLLQMYGAQAVVATDGAQAVREFQNAAPETYDAILMDIQMPVMTGYEAARAVRELSRSDAKTIPIIAMTANAFAEDIQASRDAGMDAHVAKPIDVDVLRSTVEKALADDKTGGKRDGR